MASGPRSAARARRFLTEALAYARAANLAEQVDVEDEPAAPEEDAVDKDMRPAFGRRPRSDTLCSLARENLGIDVLDMDPNLPQPQMPQPVDLLALAPIAGLDLDALDYVQHADTDAFAEVHAGAGATSELWGAPAAAEAAHHHHVENAQVVAEPGLLAPGVGAAQGALPAAAAAAAWERYEAGDAEKAIELGAVAHTAIEDRPTAAGFDPAVDGQVAAQGGLMDEADGDRW